MVFLWSRGAGCYPVGEEHVVKGVRKILLRTCGEERR
jgi:hypothetical protein